MNYSQGKAYYPDLHLHTAFSTDSTEPVRNVVERAIELGMPVIAITDHHDMDSPDGDYRLDYEAYTDELDRIKDEYSDRIRILKGIEVGIDPPLADAGLVEKYLAEREFEYIIGSVHFVDQKDPYFRDDFDFSDDVLYRKYFEQMLYSVQRTGGFNTFGHIDYIARCGREPDFSYSYARYADLIDAILEEIVRRDIILEVNTHARARLGYIHPHPDVLRRYKELGGTRLTFGSDAHGTAFIGEYFDEAARTVYDIGFRYITVPLPEGETEYPILG